MFAFDRIGPGSNASDPASVIFSLPFLSGVDLFVPATASARDQLGGTAVPGRPASGRNVPHFPSTPTRSQ